MCVIKRKKKKKKKKKKKNFMETLNEFLDAY